MPHDIGQQLAGSPHEFCFHQALQLLEGRPLAFANSVSLAFPPADLLALDEEGMTPAFIGLLGIAGVLPYHLTARFAHAGDDARALLDVLSSRAVELFAVAWRKHRPEAALDGLQWLPHALAGALDPQLLRHGAALRRGTVPAQALATILSEHFGVPVRVEQLAGRWDDMPAAARANLGGAAARLGEGCVLGCRQFRCDLRFRLLIGPLPRSSQLAFRRGGPLGGRLESVLASFALECMEAEVRVLLAAGESTGARLDGQVQLGYGAVLQTRHADAVRDDLRYLLSC